MSLRKHAIDAWSQRKELIFRNYVYALLHKGKFINYFDGPLDEHIKCLNSYGVTDEQFKSCKYTDVMPPLHI